MLRFLHVAVENLYHVLCLRYVFRYFVAHHLGVIVLVQHLHLHHSLAHCCHLRAVFGVDDGGNDVASEGWAYLVELLFVVLCHQFAVFVLHLHVEVAYLQLRAVSGKSAEQC